MRRYGLIIFSLLVIAAGFAAYLKMQPSIRVSDRPDNTVIPAGGGPTTGTAGTVIGPGEDAWVNQYNAAGELVYRFKAHHFDNYKDGRADLQSPEAEIFKSSGEVIRVQGRDGTFHADPGTDRTAMNGAPLRPPHDGYLNDVTVKVFPSIATRDAETPTVTLTTNNARFDAATNRLFAESFTDATGKTYASDEVPVTVVGHDINQHRDTFIFHGSGLVMYWSEREDRIKSLEIAHGKDMVIYDMSLLTTGKKTKPAPANAVPDHAAPSPAAAAHAAPAAPAELPRNRYIATFADNVRVLEDGVETITGDALSIDFAIKNGPPSTPSTVVPAKTDNPSPPPAGQSVQPATPPKDSGPHEVVVYWSGKLRLVPNDAATEALPEGQAIIAFNSVKAGDAVKVHRPSENGHNGFDVTCGQLAYRTTDGSLMLDSQLGAPVHIVERRPDGRGAIIDSEFITYSRADAKAILHDAGSLTAPDPNKPADTLQATWTQKCVLDLVVQPDDSLQVSQADLNGSVKVTHPRFDLDAGQLLLQFDPKAAGTDAVANNKDLSKSLELKRIIANTNATIKVHEADGHQRGITGQHLNVSTKRDNGGSLYADTVDATGTVVASEDAQSLAAENLHAELLPVPATDRQPPIPPANADALANNQVRLQYMKAWDNVRLLGKDQSQAAGDKLEITMNGDEPTVQLFGKPSAPAVVKSKDTTVTGPKITLIKNDQKCTVEGPGTMDTVQQPKDPKAAPQPMHLKWADSAMVDGKAHQIDVRGKVVAQTDKAAGALDEANSDELVLHLVDKPKDADTDKPKSKPTDDQFAFARDKQVSNLALLGEKSSVVTTLSAPNHAILKRSAIFGQHIDYDVVNKKLVIPGPGSMLEEGHAIGDYKPDNPGATAIQWQKQFVFDNATQQATIDGPVLIVHRDDGNNQQRTTVHGDQVVATFEPDKNQQAAAKPPDESMHLQIKKVVVQGNVLIDTGDAKIESIAVDFVPAVHRLICRGDEDSPVTVHDDNHKAGATFGEVWINVATNTIERLTNLNAHGRK